MKKGLITLLLLLVTALPALAAPTNTSGPWGISVSGFSNFSTAAASAATNGKTIVIDKAITVNSLTINGRTIKVLHGGSINVASGKTLTINAPLDAGRQHIFTGSGNVVFGPGSIKEAYPEWFGAKGDGTAAAATTAAIQKTIDSAYASLGSVNYIPVAFSGTYTVSDTILLKTDVQGSGTLQPDAALANKPVMKTNKPYLKIKDIHIVGGATAKANSVTGLEIAVYDQGRGCNLNSISISGFLVGLKIKTYSVTVTACNILTSNTNVSIYAPVGTSTEINNITFYGGKYWGATEYSMFLGDDRFETPITADLQGIGIALYGVDIENAPIRINNVGNVTLDGCYIESPVSTDSSANGKAVYITGTDGFTRNVQIRNNFIKNTKFGIYAANAVFGIVAEGNHFNSITHAGLYTTTDIYPVTFKDNTDTGSYSSGIEFHTGFRGSLTQGPWSSYTTNIFYRGSQISHGIPATAIPGAKYLSGGIQRLNISPTSWRTYTTPKTAIAGTKTGTIVVLGTLANIVGFNAGDAILVNSTPSYIKTIDYLTGTIYTDEYAVGNGAVTISQVATTWSGNALVYATASLPAANTASIQGQLVIEDGGAGNRNLIIYYGNERFRIDGGTAF